MKKLIIFYFAIACFKQISFAQNSVQIARDSAQIKQKDSIQIAADSTQIGNPFKYQKIQFKQMAGFSSNNHRLNPNNTTRFSSSDRGFNSHETRFNSISKGIILRILRV